MLCDTDGQQERYVLRVMPVANKKGVFADYTRTDEDRHATKGCTLYEESNR